MAKAAVGSMSEWSGTLKDFFRQIDDGSHTLEAVKAFNEHRLLSPLVTLVEATTKKLQKFFGKGVGIDPLPPEFTEANLARWAEFNLKPVFLPGEEIGENRQLKDWIKPNPWFYQKIREGKLASDSATLYRGWYLTDFTIGTNYTDGTQVFLNDPLASIIAQLRVGGKVGKHDNTPAGSRFSITHDEWTSVVLPAIAEHLGFKPERVRLERVVEFNALGNLYDPNRGKFNMWEWFTTFSRTPTGFMAAVVGMAVSPMSSYWSDDRRGYIAGRPLVSFVK